MRDGLKIATGAGAPALMALVLHGPLGQGEVFLAGRAKATALSTAPAPERQAVRAVAAAGQTPPANVAALMVIAEPRPAVGPLSAAAIVPAGRVPAGQCQKAVDGAVGGRVISFQPGSAWLNAKTLKIVGDVAATLRRCGNYTLEVAGHSDNAGDESVNRLMSQQRAMRVRDALIARGVASKALSAKGYGSSRPLRAGDAVDPANRRIGFTVMADGA